MPTRLPVPPPAESQLPGREQNARRSLPQLALLPASLPFTASHRGSPHPPPVLRIRNSAWYPSLLRNRRRSRTVGSSSRIGIGEPSMGNLRGKYAIVGVGETQVGKLPDTSTLSIHLDAVKRAMADAELRPDQIDGL